MYVLYSQVAAVSRISQEWANQNDLHELLLLSRKMGFWGYPTILGRQTFHTFDRLSPNEKKFNRIVLETAAHWLYYAAV